MDYDHNFWLSVFKKAASIGGKYDIGNIHLTYFGIFFTI
jgi:hypothetical protein